MFPPSWAQDPRNRNVKIHVAFWRTLAKVVVSLPFMTATGLQGDKPAKQPTIISHQRLKNLLKKEI
jgi:hypothetical protein